MKKVVLILLGLFLCIGLITDCSSEIVNETGENDETIAGTYEWQYDSNSFIKLEKDGDFSFASPDKKYSGTWEADAGGSIVLHFPEGSVYFTENGDYDWIGSVGEDELFMEASAGSSFMGEALSGAVYFKKR